MLNETQTNTRTNTHTHTHAHKRETRTHTQAQAKRESYGEEMLRFLPGVCLQVQDPDAPSRCDTLTGQLHSTDADHCLGHSTDSAA